MKRTAGVLVGTLIALAHVTFAQPKLTVSDYDDFYDNVILKAKNGNKAEWLASYDPVVNFVARVRQDVEALPEATRRAFAKAVHDNGYWRGQERRIRDSSDPFVGAKFKSGEDALEKVLTAKGFDAYRNRYAQGAGGYRLALEDVADRVALYKLEGKNVPRLADIPGNTYILNANAQSWNDLVSDAQRFPNPAERLAVIMRNQLNGIASALYAAPLQQAPHGCGDGLCHRGDLALYRPLQWQGWMGARTAGAHSLCAAVSSREGQGSGCLAGGPRRAQGSVSTLAMTCPPGRPRPQSARSAATGSIDAARRAGSHAARHAAAASSATTETSVSGSYGAVWNRKLVMTRVA